MSSVINTPISPWELLDKITVLEIKAERIIDPARLANVKTELNLLHKTKAEHFSMTPELEVLAERLKKSNQEIWDYGEKIRELGEAKEFGEALVKVAWDIHVSNDRRAALKKEINLLLGSKIIEEKSYKHWK